MLFRQFLFFLSYFVCKLKGNMYGPVSVANMFDFHRRHCTLNPCWDDGISQCLNHFTKVPSHSNSFLLMSPKCINAIYRDQPVSRGVDLRYVYVHVLAM